MSEKISLDSSELSKYFRKNVFSSLTNTVGNRRSNYHTIIIGNNPLYINTKQP